VNVRIAETRDYDDIDYGEGIGVQILEDCISQGLGSASHLLGVSFDSRNEMMSHTDITQPNISIDIFLCGTFLTTYFLPQHSTRLS
jgi:hypothetical protein